jgi:hypothetical protein
MPLTAPGRPGGVGRSIDLGRVTDLARTDWGLCHTIERNLGRAVDQARAEPPEGGAFDPVAAAEAIRSAIDAAPKTTGWRLRARVGERMPWYQTPEEVRHDG